MRNMTGIIWLTTILCVLAVSIGEGTQWPVDGDKKIFTTYGEYQHYEEDPYYLHAGLDIAAPAGSYVNRCMLVSSSGIDESSGIRILVRIPNRRLFIRFLEPTSHKYARWDRLFDFDSDFKFILNLMILTGWLRKLSWRPLVISEIV